MKASEMIIQLQELIAEHGDLPLAMMEKVEDGYGDYCFVECDGIDGVYDLGDSELFYDSDDCCVDVNKVFLID